MRERKSGLVNAQESETSFECVGGDGGRGEKITAVVLTTADGQRHSEEIYGPSAVYTIHKERNANPAHFKNDLQQAVACQFQPNYTHFVVLIEVSLLDEKGDGYF